MVLKEGKLVRVDLEVHDYLTNRKEFKQTYNDIVRNLMEFYIEYKDFIDKEFNTVEITAENYLSDDEIDERFCDLEDKITALENKLKIISKHIHSLKTQKNQKNFHTKGLLKNNNVKNY